MKGAPTLVACPACEGEGFIEVEIPGGRFDTRAGQWYPEVEERPCGRCHGTGEITVCLHCYHDRCFCQDDTKGERP